MFFESIFDEDEVVDKGDGRDRRDGGTDGVALLSHKVHKLFDLLRLVSNSPLNKFHRKSLLREKMNKQQASY